MLEFYNEVGRWYDNGNQQSYSVDVKAIVENGRLEPVFNRVRRTYQVPTKCASSIFFLLTDAEFHKDIPQYLICGNFTTHNFG